MEFSHVDRTRWPLLVALLISGCLCPRTVCAEDTKEPAFERDVRPILKAHCFRCHGEGSEVEGGLDIRLRRLLLKGGESGPAIVPGRPDESLLWERIQLGEMPPEEAEIRPTAEEVERIRAWILAGAPTLRAEPESIAPGNFISSSTSLPIVCRLVSPATFWRKSHQEAIKCNKNN